jgi:two-component system OmpR family response regulator
LRVLIAEEDDRSAGFVIKGLEEAGFIVDHCLDGLQGLNRALNINYDAVIIDTILPKLDGYSLVEKLRAAKKNFPIMLISSQDSVPDKVKGLQIGADDYLSKPFAFAELLARVQALIRRTSDLSEPSELTVSDLNINLITREVTRANKKIDLQPREFSLLEYLMRNAGRLVSKTMIMEHVWNYNFDPRTNVVEARICSLRDKVDRQPFKKLIYTVRGAGYVLREEPSAV